MYIFQNKCQNPKCKKLYVSKDHGCANKEKKSFGNTNHAVRSPGDILKKKELKKTNKNIIVLITISFNTTLACLNWYVRSLVFNF